MPVSMINGVLLILIGTLGYSLADIPCDDPSVCPSGTKCFYRPCSPREEDFVCECSEMFSGLLGPVGYDCNSFGPNNNGLHAPTYYETCYGSHCHEGSFQSFGYPNQYRNRETAIYLLFVPGARNITFTFEGEGGFEIEANKDDLYVGTGLDISPHDLNFQDISTKDKEVRYFDSRSVAVGERYPPPFSFETDAAWMFFETDANMQFRGWRLSWTAELHVLKDCPDTMVIETCNNEEKVSWKEPSVIDPSLNVNVSSSNLPGDSFSIGSHTVVIEAEDRFKNVEQCSFKIEIKKKPTCTPSRPVYMLLIITTSASLVMLLLLTICLCLFVRKCKRSKEPVRDGETNLPAIPPRSPLNRRRNDYENDFHPSHLYDETPPGTFWTNRI